MKMLQRFLGGMLAAIMVASLVIPGITVNAAEDENPYGGQDYYLDATGGDDANDGTSPDKAWKNLTKANETTFSPGDRILLKSGEVWENQQLWPKGSGEESRPITIDMYGDESLGRPYIAANGNVDCPISGTGDKDKITEKVGLTGAIVLRNQQYWEIHNMELSNDDDFETDITTGLVVRDGINISINADLLADGDDTIMNYFRISNCYIHDIDGPSTWQKIHYGGICFQVFGSKSYDEYDTSGYYFQDVRIENNRFERCELHAIQFAFNWFYDRQTSHGEYDEDGKWHEGWEQLWVRTRDLYSRDVYIGNNYAENTGQGAVQLANTKNLVCEYNEINGFLKRYSQVSAGLYLWAGADSVMQFNECYDGPANEYDATPWDLEYTNFNVTYQYNYSHDNKGGWMSYMGNSSNSIARYNLSINDNGVIWKNMLSTNYSPTYVVNNVFIWDGSKLDSFHDEVLKDTVYFYNNIFYNTSTTPTNWQRRDNGLANGIFSNNVYYEAGQVQAENKPNDLNGITEDPLFVSNPTDYEKDGIGVANIREAAANFKLQDDSPLIDKGQWISACGEQDFFETELYYGDQIDIGLYEAPIGEKTDPTPSYKTYSELQYLIAAAEAKDQTVYTPSTWVTFAAALEEAKSLTAESEETTIHAAYLELDRAMGALAEVPAGNLAQGKPITANYTHPQAGLGAENLVDGDTTTRWACCDPDQMIDGYPIEIDIDFLEDVVINKVFLDEYEDSGTNLRIDTFELQRWDTDTGDWVTFKEVTGGMGHDLNLEDFEPVTTSKLRLLITGQKATEYWTPSMTEIQVYGRKASEAVYNPSLAETIAVYDKNETMIDNENNAINITFIPDGDTIDNIEYYGPEGNKLRDLYEGDHYTLNDNVYSLSQTFLSSLNNGKCRIKFTTGSGVVLDFYINTVNTTDLVMVIEEGEARDAADTTEAGRTLIEAINAAKAVLEMVNRSIPAVGNETVDNDIVESAFATLRTAISDYDEAIAENAGSEALRELLQAMVDELGNAAQEEFEPEEWDEYQQALEAVKLLLEKEVGEINPAEATEAGKALLEAYSKKITSTGQELETLLQDLTGRADEMLGNREIYTSSSAAMLEEAVDNARQVLENPESTTIMRKEAIEKMFEAISNLVLRGNKEILQSLYDTYSQLDETAYTVESYQRLLTALEQAETILNDSDAVQDEIERAVTELLDAVANLAEREVPDENEEEDVTITGIPTSAIKVGDTFTLTPSKDGGEWIYDQEFFQATFNSPATFTALKEGNTTITYRLNRADYNVSVTIEPVSGENPSAETPTGQNGKEKTVTSSSGNSSAASGNVKTGDESRALLWTLLALLSAVITIVVIRRRKV